MELGLFFMPLHRPHKAWAQALDEDRQAILAADRAGYAEVWVGEHFTTKAEQIPAPLLFLSSLIHQTKLRLGTGVVNLGHRHPVVVAAEAALFDQLSGGRLMLGVGPGGLSSDAELFGRPDQEQRFDAAMEAIDMIKRLWAEEAPISLDGTYWQGALEEQFWPGLGVGQFPKPLQQPHPPLAMALVSPGGRTTETVAERSFIPISANFVPQSSLLAQWEAYRRRRQELGLVVDRSIWRVCRSLLVTDSDAEADELVSDPDGTFAFYFRYLGAVRDLVALRCEPEVSIAEMNERYRVEKAIEKCVMASSASTLTDRLIEMVDYLGPFGTLVSVGHDWDGTDRWSRNVTRLAEEVAPKVAQHMASLPARD